MNRILTIIQFIAQIFTEKRPLDTVAVGALARGMSSAPSTIYEVLACIY